MNINPYRPTPSVSRIIRIKKEERWINHCLSAAAKPSLKSYENISADNHFNDYTVIIAKKYTNTIIYVTQIYPEKIDSKDTVKVARGKNTLEQFIRQIELSAEKVSLPDVSKYTI